MDTIIVPSQGVSLFISIHNKLLFFISGSYVLIQRFKSTINYCIFLYKGMIGPFSTQIYVCSHKRTKSTIILS